MSKDLIIVESPAKAKTIQKFIGKEFDVISSKGHIRDLPQKDIGIDIENSFTPKYEIIDDKKKLIQEIKKLSEKADTVWLATDDDREGEAISWHLIDTVKIPADKVKRIVFHEITKSAIDNALAHPRQLDVNLVNAQQARRVLDRLVGFELSPVLWHKVKPQLSAGRVQSVTVKLIVEREREINQFKTTSSYKVGGTFTSVLDKSHTLKADLNKKFNTKEEAVAFLEDCKNIEAFTIDSIETNPSKKSPAPPFTTSTLQQEASRKLGFPVKKTMMVAQQLYEAGYITYMRTDSVNLSSLALNTAKEEITKLYGADYAHTRKYVTKSKGAQEAHEAIRPTFLSNHTIDGDKDAKKLYELIWRRTIASQMSDAKIEKTEIRIPVDGRSEQFVSTGEVVLFQGFLKVYIESKDEEEETDKEFLSPVKKGEKLYANEISAVQKFSQPPLRYTEASLVKKMEELGIGRPSTYAPAITTIQDRQYVEKKSLPGQERDYCQITLKNKAIKETVKKEKYGMEKDKLFPTDIGYVVNDFLQKNFGQIMDYGFTADVEKEFDDIAEGSVEWQKMMTDFYHHFHPTIEEAMTHSAKASGERLLGKDPKTGENVYAKLGKYGPMAQIGEVSDDKKPKYARLKKTQSIDNITLEEALELFKLPRVVGKYEGADITIGIGKFGPYIRYDNKFVTLPKEDEPTEVSYERCLELIEQKKKTDAERAPHSIGMYNGLEIVAAVGKYGPYLKYNNKNYTLGKGFNINEITLDKAIELLGQNSNKNVIATFAEDENIKVMNGHYGAYLTNGSNNFKIPKDKNPETLTYADCLQIMSTIAPSAKKRGSTRKK